MQWKFAVPSKGACKELVRVSYKCKHETLFSGYAIDVFEEVVKSLHLNYSYEPFNGTYNDMIKAVSDQRYDGAVRDITVFAERLEYFDFTQPYVNSEVMMVVPKNPMKWTRLWELLKSIYMEDEVGAYCHAPLRKRHHLGDRTRR